MSGFLLSASDPAYAVAAAAIRRAGRDAGSEILFAGIIGSYPAGLNLRGSDLDIEAVGAGQAYFHHKYPEQADVRIIGLERILNEAAGYAPERFPVYHHRSPEEAARERRAGPLEHGDNIRNLIRRLFQSRCLLDEKGRLRAGLASLTPRHLNLLDNVDMLYTYARGLYDTYLPGPDVPVRKYLNALQKTWSIRWMLEKNTLPPARFEEIARHCASESVRHEAVALLQLYKTRGQSKETCFVAANNAVNEYLRAELESLRREIEACAAFHRDKNLVVAYC